MKYPSKTDYNNALQHPQIAFKNLDPELEKGHAIKKIKNKNGYGFWIASGAFACVFKFQTQQKLWALRCPTQEIGDMVKHYQKVHDFLDKKTPSREYFVDFQFLEKGILVKGNIYPLIKMEWSEGLTLNTFLEKNLNNRNKLESLAKCWLELCEKLINDKIAHGDLQHGNILVVETNNNITIKLVDYDSLYYEPVDKTNSKDEIKGLPGYQHPLRNDITNKSLNIDYFSQIVIYLSIIALAEKPQLWQDYKLLDADRLLFTLDNFKYPDDSNKSKIFNDLANLSDNVSKLSQELKNICQLQDFSKIPSLNEVLKTINPTANQVIKTVDGSKFFIKEAKNRHQTNINPPEKSEQKTTQPQVNTTKNPVPPPNKDSSNQPPSPPINSTIDATNHFTAQTGIKFTDQAESVKTLSSQLSSKNKEITLLKDQILDLENENKKFKNSLINRFLSEYEEIAKLKTRTLLLIILSFLLGVISLYQHQEIKELREQIGNVQSKIDQ